MKLLRIRPDVGQIQREGSAVDTCLLLDDELLGVDFAGAGLLAGGGVVLTVCWLEGWLGGGFAVVSTLRSWTFGRLPVPVVVTEARGCSAESCSTWSG